MKKYVFLIIFYSVSIFLLSQNITISKILEKIDKNQTADAKIATTTMIINNRRGTRKIISKIWMKGSQKSFSEYLFPAREKGTKMLKIDNKLWMYNPDADRIIQLSGHLLRQSVMGSDLSYEDYMEDDKLAELYEASIDSISVHNDRKCWIISLESKVKNNAYAKRKIWVDQERFIVLSEERFAESGKLLKKTDIPEVIFIDGRWFPKRIVFRDMLNKSSKGTELIIDTIEFDVDIPDSFFSKAKLRK